MTTAQALAWGRSQLPEQHRRDVELLLRAATGWDTASLVAHPELTLDPEQEAGFRAMLARRAVGEPVQYILGKQEFWGMEFHVTADVLIPRPETEHVIEAVLARVPRDAEPRIADVGTGSGAIAVALAKELQSAQILATDISPDALTIARENATRHGVAGRLEFVACDLLPAQLQNCFDVVVSNPPYVAVRDGESLPREVHDFEPHAALFAGEDGYAVYRRLIPAARHSLKADGWLVMELGAGQAQSVLQMLQDWREVSTSADLQGIARVVCARKPRDR